ncbi:hypothetical protein OH76DRAFT_923585 [Lentinus brumalis]|uniref:Uncharacterized protein n=1 Tax=Lentinus brumalis TaxID=2498619 RepID=A0A371CZT7_9APHY|nr:hypothetical protein OH76DRAFT_923585 [Polyporus brumalis]
MIRLKCLKPYRWILDSSLRARVWAAPIILGVWCESTHRSDLGRTHKAWCSQDLEKSRTPGCGPSLSHDASPMRRVNALRWTIVVQVSSSVDERRKTHTRRQAACTPCRTSEPPGRREPRASSADTSFFSAGLHVRFYAVHVEIAQRYVQSLAAHVLGGVWQCTHLGSYEPLAGGGREQHTGIDVAGKPEMHCLAVACVVCVPTGVLLLRLRAQGVRRRQNT